MKEKINVTDYAGHIISNLKNGILLTTKADNKVNSMTIAWGQIGIEWNKPIFTVYVRDSRYTKEMLDKNPEFTLNIPIDDNFDKKIMGYCGLKSGVDTDKIDDLGLTLIPSEDISVPGIKELPLTLECKVSYKQLQDESSISPENKDNFYPESVSMDPSNNKHYHIAYYGEIVNAYIIRD